MNIKTKIVTALTLAVLVVPGISMAQTMSVAQLQAEIQSLTAQLTQLEAQLTAAGGSTTAWCYTFNSNLSIGMSGNAITELQTALQKDGESVTVNGTFDDQTAAAVTGFQEKYASAILSPYGLTNGTGYAGKSTRAELNSLFGCGISPVQPVGPAPVQPTPVNPSPAMSVYQNSQYGVRFSYPSNYTVRYGNAAFGTSGDYGNQMGDDGIGLENPNLTSLVTIEMPSNSYPDTGFDGAYLNVSVAPQMNSSQCSAMNTAGSSPSSGIKTIGGVPFNWSVDGSAAAGTDFTNGSFSGYTNGTCYVLLAGGEEGNGAIGNVASDGTIITAVNQNSILAALNSVLATMTFSAPMIPTTSAIQVVIPNTGTTWTSGTAQTITWTPPQGVSRVVIELENNVSTNGCQTSGCIYNSGYQNYLVTPQGNPPQNTGSFFWTVGSGNDQNGNPITIPPGTYAVTIQGLDANGNSIPGGVTGMSGWFTIVSATSPTQTYSLSPSFGSAGIVTTLSPIFSVCGSNAPVGECTEDRFDTYEWIENGSNVVTQTAPGGTNGAETFQIPTSFGPGTYELTVQNNLGITGTTYSLAAFTVTAGGTSSNGTVNVSLDPSTPVAGTVAAGTKNVTFANIKLTVTGGNAQMQWFSVVSNSANAVSGLSNIKLFEGSTLLGSAQNLLAFPSVPGGYVNVPESVPLIIQNGTSVTLTIMADIAPSASGSLDLGIGGGAGAPMSPNYSIYGNNMTVSGAPSAISTMLNVAVASNSNLFNGAVPAGSSNVMIGSYAINNPSTEPVTLNQLTLDFGQSTAVLTNVAITLNGGGQIAIVPTLDLSANDVSPSVTLNSNAVTIPAGGSATLGVYASVGASSPAGATETTSVKSCSAQGGISYAAYSCNAVTGYEFMVK